MVRAVKNRYGPTDEVGCFELGEAGIKGLSDPSALFLSHTIMGVPGTCVTVTLEGRRPLALEVQALAVPSSLTNPRRTTSGIDGSRLAMILAVMHRHGGVKLDGQDVYMSTVGGAKVGEPAADLALAMAILSASTNKPLTTGTIAIGEVGLSGELRQVSAMSRRLSEAARLGFTRAIIPAGVVHAAPAGMQLFQAGHVAEAISYAQ